MCCVTRRSISSSEVLIFHFSGTKLDLQLTCPITNRNLLIDLPQPTGNHPPACLDRCQDFAYVHGWFYNQDTEKCPTPDGETSGDRCVM